MKKSLTALFVAVSVILIAALGASIALNISAIGKFGSLGDDVASIGTRVESLGSDISELSKKVTEFAGSTDDVAAENDVTIAGNYVIRSTENISEAYISGDSSKLSDRDLETLDMASEILESIVDDGMTDYEKEEQVYLWMIRNLKNDGGILPVIPTTAADCDNPYGVLKYHNAVCVGYATTFRLFMQMCGIECKVVHNSERYHSWDLVKLGDGWYHTDIYSDVGSSGYAHFNLTDSMMDGQNWNRDYFPAADKFDYCYAYVNSVECADVYAFPAMLRSGLDEEKTIVAVRLSGDGAKADAYRLYGMMSEIESRTMYSLEYGELSLVYTIIPTDFGMIFSVNVVYPEDNPKDPDDVLTDEDRLKMSEAVEIAFGDLTDNGYDPDDYDFEGDIVW